MLKMKWNERQIQIDNFENGQKVWKVKNEKARNVTQDSQCMLHIYKYGLLTICPQVSLRLDVGHHLCCSSLYGYHLDTKRIWTDIWPHTQLKGSTDSSQPCHVLLLDLFCLLWNVRGQESKTAWFSVTHNLGNESGGGGLSTHSMNEVVYNL